MDELDEIKKLAGITEFKGYQPYGGAPPKPIPSMSSADSAKALLDKLMRRPR